MLARFFLKVGEPVVDHLFTERQNEPSAGRNAFFNPSADLRALDCVQIAWPSNI